MLSFKAGEKIHLNDMSTQILLGLIAVENVFDTYGVETVVTSANDGKHMTGSKHYTGDAVDLRSRDFTDEAEKEKALKDCKAVLGNNFDMILESHHFHLEYDPK